MLGTLQRVGKSLMMPIAVLPAAALLLRFGVYFQEVSWLSWGDFVWKVMAAGGDAVFSNLPLIFAIGVAIGFSGGAGAAGLAGGVGHLILVAINGLTEVTPAVVRDGETVSEATTIDMGVLGGIIIGLTAATLYRRFKGIELPDYLGFFGGRRFVPIITAFAAIGIGLLAALIWPPIGRGIDAFGNWLVAAGAVGALIYGIANRALLPFGLHHILNAIVWFQIGTFTADGEVVRGDLNRFFAGDPEAGIFMAGWFLVMMFGLPAAAYAMYRAADDDEKGMAKAIYGSSGFTSFLTGITEPLEYSFLFLAPVLFGAHAVLSGSAMAVANALNIRHGFGFSAGLIDYLVNFGLSENALLLIPVGLVYAVIYYLLFTFAIRVFDLPTPGRASASERDSEDVTEEESQSA
ncbi:MAG: PTS transporter subunit EIIC [Egibacteraceae bacterium]